MAAKDYQIAFNRGVVDERATARGDVKRIAMSAAEQMNWMPHTLGAMSLRPGLEYIGAIGSTDGAVRLFPFVFSLSDTAVIEVTSSAMRFWVDDALVTRAAVATSFTNSGFDTDLTGWANEDEGAGGVSSWVTDGLTGGFMQLTGNGANGAKRTQTLSVASGDQNVEHALRIVVKAGSFLLRVGDAAGKDNYIRETELGLGIHSLAFTPTGGSVYVQLINRKSIYCNIDVVAVEGAGVLSMGTSLLPAETLDFARYTQSGDILFIARGTQYDPVKIERRSKTSWSLVAFYGEDGPFRPDNVTKTTIAASALVSTAAAPEVTLTASRAIFTPQNVGGLYRLTSKGQNVISPAAATVATSTKSIRVFGIETGRVFTIGIAGTGFTGTVTLEQSIGAEGSWLPVKTWTADTTETYDDKLDNQVVFYRLTLTAYSAGSVDMKLSFPTGSITGIVRVSGYTDASTLKAVVLQDLGSTDATDDWAEGAWSPRRGFPSAVTIYQSRLYWAGKDKVWASAVDDYYSYSDLKEGDATPISRSIGSGPVDTINWLLPTRQLLVGAQGAELLARSNSIDEPITPSNFNLKEVGTSGSSPVDPVKVDSTGFFIDRSGQRLYQIEPSADGTVEAADATVLAPTILYPRIHRMAAQRRPETRILMVACDGRLVVMSFDKAEEMKSLWTMETRGLFEDVVTIPGDCAEDKVYVVVLRVVGGVAVRFLEKWARTSEAQGGANNKMADAFKTYKGAPTNTIAGLDHLEGATVVAWGNSKNLGTYTVTGGTVLLSESVTEAYIGLPYYASFISNKMGASTIGVPAMGHNTRVSSLQLILTDASAGSLEYGTDATHLDGMPTVDEGAETPAGYVWPYYDNQPIPINGSASTNTRLYLKATAPEPCTVLGVLTTIEGM